MPVVFILGQPYYNKGRPYRPVQMARSAQRGASNSHDSYSSRSEQSSFSALPALNSHHASSARVSTGSASGYKNQQLYQRRGCFECGDVGHIKRECPRLLNRTPQQSSRSMVPAPSIPPPTHLARGGAQSARHHLRGGGRSGCGQTRFYAIPARPDIVASDAVITGIVSVCHREDSILFDPGSTYSYASSYFICYLDKERWYYAYVHRLQIVEQSYD
ncbi:uncharacterized protein [Nicotiana tomentosiformis]|uniref:uncharacterized protein n=1 Tax=Nicotiana tomentosiformis TaxID=4098 RepID=UPI00388C8C21